MAKETTKTGKALERQVADAYRVIGARKVEHDVELAGHQIDVCVEMETVDHSIHRIAVEVKDYAKPVGIKIVADFAAVVDGLRRLKSIDEGVIVSAAGFSKPARNAAKEHGLRLLEPADLKAMVGVPDLAQACADYLARAVAAYEARMYQRVVSSIVPPEHPYKFLYAFEVEDAGIFFGRDAASEDFCQTLLRDRLTVLHAKSGAGKTSLLNAGVSLRLIREGRLPVYARAYDDPVRAVKETIAPPSLGPWPDPLPKLSLHEFLGLVCAHLSRRTRELVVILDQFEEFFIFWPEREHRQPFIDALADCYDDKSLAVRFIIALRKDYYSDLATFQCRLPHIFHNEYCLDAMARAEAQAAITGPAAKLGRPVTYEPVLLDTLLDDLARGGMELPHLQIICTQLYETLDEGQRTITLVSYGKVGWAEGVLGRYLNEVLDRLPGEGGAIAKELLKELVSSEATKRVLSYDRLAARVEAETDELESLLAQLVDARLLRRDEVAGDVTYEMAHEYLIEEIRQWVDRADLAFKQAEELLAREVANWRVYGTLIPRERIELLYTQRERLVGIGDEAWECILCSALRADFVVEDWAELAGELGEQIFLEALSDSLEGVRRAAIRGLGKLWGIPEVSRLGSENIDVRWDAVPAVGKLGDPRAVKPLVAALRDSEDSKDSDWHWMVTEALIELCDSRAVEPLISALQSDDGCVRLEAAKLLGLIGDRRAVEPLIFTLQDEYGDVRDAAAEALGRLGSPQAVELLVAALRSEIRESYERLEIVNLLGEIGDSRAVEPLIDALWDPNTDVCLAVAEALGKIGDPCAVEQLISALRDADGDVRLAAAEVLGELGDSRALEPLIAALWGDDSDVRAAAAQALGKIGDHRAAESLIVTLRDEYHYVRQVAATALGRIGDPRAVKPLSAALLDQSRNWRGQYYVQEAASEALKRIGTPEALAALEEWQRQQA